MCGPISGEAYRDKGVVKQCCCGCTLRTGSLTIGWLEIVGGLLMILSLGFELEPLANEDQEYLNAGGRPYYECINIVITLLAGLLILIGTYKQNSRVFWIAVYIEFCSLICGIAVTIIYFAEQLWLEASIGLISCFVSSYYFIVLRSYAYEMNAGKDAPLNQA